MLTRRGLLQGFALGAAGLFVPEPVRAYSFVGGWRERLIDNEFLKKLQGDDHLHWDVAWKLDEATCEPLHGHVHTYEEFVQAVEKTLVEALLDKKFMSASSRLELSYESFDDVLNTRTLRATYKFVPLSPVHVVTPEEFEKMKEEM